MESRRDYDDDGYDYDDDDYDYDDDDYDYDYDHKHKHKDKDDYYREWFQRFVIPGRVGLTGCSLQSPSGVARGRRARRKGRTSVSSFSSLALSKMTDWTYRILCFSGVSGLLRRRRL